MKELIWISESFHSCMHRNWVDAFFKKIKKAVSGNDCTLFGYQNILYTIISFFAVVAMNEIMLLHRFKRPLVSDHTMIL